MRRLRALAAAALLAAALVPALGAGTACAREGGSAALVIDTGERVVRLCVALPERAVSGIDLIQLAADQHGLAYSLGYGGGAVCSLAGVGPTGSDCFADYPRFWGYWRGDGEGGWTWSNVGAGSTVVEAGDVEGWSWGEGNDGETHPQPPAVRFEQVCAAEPSPRPVRTSPSTTPEASTASGPSPDSRSSTATPPERSPSPSPARGADPGSERSASPVTPAVSETVPTPRGPADSPAGASGGGAGAGAVVAGGLAAGLGLAAALVRRRRGR